MSLCLLGINHLNCFYQRIDVIAGDGEADHRHELIAVARCLLLLGADEDEQGRDDGDMEEIDPQIRGGRAPTLERLEAVIDEDHEAEADEQPVDPLRRGRAHEADAEEEGGHEEEMEDGQDDVGIHAF